MNSINVITPYKENGIWRFSDSSKGLEGEPFVGGTNKLIDQLIHDSLYVKEGDEISIYFSDTEFLGAEFVLGKTELEYNGAWYSLGLMEDSLEGWLCPATLKYFKTFPKRIYISLYTK